MAAEQHFGSERVAPREGSLARRALVAVALLAAALVPLLPVLLAAGFPSTYETFRYEVLSTLFADAIAHGHAYPRWLPALAGGRGYPTFLFYQPLVFYVAAIVRLLPGVTAAAMMYVGDYLAALAGVAGAYRLARAWLVNDRAAAVGLALLFALTPYAYTDLHVGGGHAEFLAMMLTPWPVVALQAIARRLDRDERPRLLGPIACGAIASAGVVLAHPAVALAFGPVVALFAVARAAAFDAARRRRWLAACVAMAALALLLSSPYWFVVLQSRGDVRLDRATAGAFEPTRHLIGPSELFFGRGGPPDAADIAADHLVPVGLGVAHAALAAAGAVVAARSGLRRAPWGIGAAVAAAGLVALALPWARPVWALPTPLRLLQFPWRLLATLAVVQIVLAAHATAAVPPRVRAWLVLAACAAALAWHAPMFRTNVLRDPAGRPVPFAAADARIGEQLRTLRGRDVDFALMHEFDPVWHQTPGEVRGDAPMFAAGPGATLAVSPEATEYRPAAHVDAAAPTAVVLRQLYFPGWRVEVNGTPVPDDDLRANLLPDGQMVVAVPAGASRIVAAYDGPPGWRPRVAVTWLGLLLIAAALRRWQRRIASTP